MTEQSLSPEMPDATGHKKCRACRKEMPADANKCTECGSVQNWERFLTLSGSVLGLLVALISVSTFALPIWQKALAPKPEPRSYFALLNFEGTAAIVAVSNEGSAPAVVKSAELILSPEGFGYSPSVFLAIRGDDLNARVIQPGDMRVLFMALPTESKAEASELLELLSQILDSKEQARCTLKVDVQNTEFVTQEQIPFGFKCSELRAVALRVTEGSSGR